MGTGSLGIFNLFLMLILILSWGSSFVFVKILLIEGLTPIAIATARFLVAGGFFLITILIKRKNMKDFRLFEKRDILQLIILTFTGVTFYFIAQYIGIKMAGASVAAIFSCLLTPIFIILLSAKLFKEHLARKQVFGIGIASVGTFIVIIDGNLNPQINQTSFIGGLILLLTPILWTVYSLLGKKMMKKYSPFLVVAYVNVLGGLFFIPFSLAEGSFNQIITMNVKELIVIIFLGTTCSFLGYYIWFYIIKSIGAAIASSSLFAEPLITVIFAVVFIGEELSFFVAIGGVLIFIGVYLVTTCKTFFSTRIPKVC